MSSMDMPVLAKTNVEVLAPKGNYAPPTPCPCNPCSLVGVTGLWEAGQRGRFQIRGQLLSLSKEEVVTRRGDLRRQKALLWEYTSL